MDTTGLRCEPMKRVRKDWQGARYYDLSGKLVCKTCTRCREVLPIGTFPKMRGQKDGLSTKCSPCGSAVGMSYYWKKRESVAPLPRKYIDTLEVIIPSTGEVKELRGIEVVMMKKATSTEWRGSVYYDKTGNLVAKSCSRCRNIISPDGFGRSEGKREGLESSCRKCNSSRYYAYLKEREKQEPGFMKNRSEKRYDKLARRSPEEVGNDTRRLREEGAKWCRGCRDHQGIELFNSNKYTSDGLSVMCRKCHNADGRMKYHRVAEKYWTEVGIPHECYLSTCRKPYQEQDHVIPLELGGPDTVENLLPMCEHHNRSKNDSPLEDWLSRRHPEALEDTINTVIGIGIEFVPIRPQKYIPRE